MGDRLKVGCIIVNYNNYERTIKLATSICSYRAIDHIIIVDNKSTDISVDKLKEIENSKIELIISKKNVGYGAGNNLGIIKAEELGCKYIFIANPDVEFSENCISDMINKMEINDTCAIMGAKEEYLSVYAWKYMSDIPDILCSSILFNKILRNYRYYKKDYFKGSGVKQADVIPGCFFVLRTKSIKNIGYYDERFFLYEEEKVLYKKISDKGYLSLVDLDVSYEHMHIEHPKSDVSSYMRTKRHLLNSKMLFLTEYRHISNIKKNFAQLIFTYAKVEMYIYAKILILLRRV